MTIALACFGRAISEVGAVMIVGGNIRHSTRVMTTSIALATSMGELAFAMALGVVLLLVALAVNIASQLVRHNFRIWAMTSDKGTPDIILKARDLTLTRDGVTLLDAVSADIRRGRITLLLGHNGAGKTLLLNSLHGVFDCDSGTIEGPPA